jgi:transposase
MMCGAYRAGVVSEPRTRQVPPQVAAVLLSKLRSDLTARQAEIVDQLKERRPAYAMTRRLSFGFRSILSRGKVTTLHRWLGEARRTKIHPLERLVRIVKQDLGAVESAVAEKWSNGPVEGQINRLKALKRQMYGRAGVELLRARTLPLPMLKIERPPATKMRKTRFKCQSPGFRSSATPATPQMQM